MKRLFNISDDVYNANINIYVGSHDQMENYFNKKYGCEKEPQKYSAGSSFAVTFEDRPGVTIYFIWLPEFDWTIEHQQTIAHELIHTVFKIFAKRNIKFTTNNHEHFAYYYDSLLGKIYKKLLYFRR